MPSYKNILNALLILSFIIYSNSCPPGTFPFMKKCLQCKEGTYSPNGNSCYPCPQGTYSSIIGATECNLCLPGTYNPYKGKTRCQLCSPGSFSNELGASSCKNCPYGSYSDLGATSCYEKMFSQTLDDYLYNNYHYDYHYY